MSTHNPEISLYIRRLVALSIMTGAALFFENILPWFYLLPAALAVFGIIISRINGEKPAELFNHQNTEKFFRKGGIRELLKIVVALFAFAYDIVVWILWGAWQVVNVGIDIIYLLKWIGYYVLQALLWFFKLYVPFWRLVYYYTVHYLIKWPWWIYRNAFHNIKYTYKSNIYRVALVAAFLSLLIFHIFYFLEEALFIHSLRIMGILLGMLPIAWAMGEIAALRSNNAADDSGYSVSRTYGNGLESVRSLLFFIAFFILILLVQVGLNTLHWIPGPSAVLLGVTLNINSFLSFGLLLLAVLILFGTLSLPYYRMYYEYVENSLQNTLHFLSFTGRNTLHYLSALIPGSFFGAIVSLVPFLLLAASLWVTNLVTDNLIGLRIDQLKEAELNAPDFKSAYRIQKNIDHLEYLSALPKGLIQEMQHRQSIEHEVRMYTNDLKSTRREVFIQEEGLRQKIQDIERTIADNGSNLEKEQEKNSLLAQLKNIHASKQVEIDQLEIDIEFLKRRDKQLPIVFYLMGLWVVCLTSFVMAAFLGFIANFYFDVFTFRNNEIPTYLYRCARDEYRIDRNQPLLSTTLNLITIGLIIVAFLIAKSQLLMQG